MGGMCVWGRVRVFPPLYSSLSASISSALALLKCVVSVPSWYLMVRYHVALRFAHGARTLPRLALCPLARCLLGACTPTPACLLAWMCVSRCVRVLTLCAVCVSALRLRVCACMYVMHNVAHQQCACMHGVRASLHGRGFCLCAWTWLCKWGKGGGCTCAHAYMHACGYVWSTVRACPHANAGVSV
jgi:hypothetical protein